MLNEVHIKICFGDCFSSFFFRQKFPKSCKLISNFREWVFSRVQYTGPCEPVSNLEPAEPRETGLSPCFCSYFPSVGWSEILGLLFWLCCMPVASQAQPAIISFVNMKTMYYAWSSGPWKASMDKTAPIWDNVVFGHKVIVKSLWSFPFLPTHPWNLSAIFYA